MAIRYKLLKILIIYFLGLLLLPVTSLALKEPESCSNYSYSKSTAAQRMNFLRQLKDTLLQETNKASINLQWAQDFLKNCDSDNCKDFRNKLHENLVEQMHVAKIARAIAESPLNLFSKAHPPRTLRDIMIRKQRELLRPEQIAHFDIPGFTFSKTEKNQVFEIWFQVFVKVAWKMGIHTNIREIFLETRRYFRLASQGLIQANPLLAFVDENVSKEPEQLYQAFLRVIEFNTKFASRVENMNIDHSDSLMSNVTILIKDHEMGLVNFQKQAELMIDESETKNQSCSVWKDLRRQQKTRVLTSIGVGFVTSVVCGVGSLSGVGAVGAAAYCFPAILDGLVGAWRGHRDAQIAYHGFNAGRKIDLNGHFSDGLMNLENSSLLMNQAEVVYLVNLLGLIPVAQTIRHAHQVQAAIKAGHIVIKPRTYDYLILPTSDTLVTANEVASSAYSYLILLVRGFEFITQETSSEVEEILKELNLLVAQ